MRCMYTRSKKKMSPDICSKLFSIANVPLDVKSTKESSLTRLYLKQLQQFCREPPVTVFQQLHIHDPIQPYQELNRSYLLAIKVI